jgi:uncharacterized protein YndB with AHSA1/START domain
VVAASIRLEELIPQPPGRVWAALTEPALLARWWAAGDIRPVVGHRFTMDMGAWGQQPCEVLAVQPRRLLSYAFAPETLHTAITFRLEPEGEGTRLSLEHAGFELDDPQGRQAYQGMGAGWPRVLQRIAPVLAATPA